MDQSRTRGTMSQSTLPYVDAYGRTDLPPTFSNPWVAQNPTSAPYVPMTSTTMPSTTSDLSSLPKPYHRQNNSYLPTSTYGTSYADQTVTSGSPTAGATSYGMGTYGYDQSSKNNLQSSLVDYTRSSLTGNTYATADALEASRGMMNLSQGMPTSRFSMPTSQHRNSSSASSSSYYPGSVSGASSISSASSYPHSYYGSMDASAVDMASVNGDHYDIRQTLPRPNGMIQSQAAFPHQGSMMTTFNSRVQTNTQKKHKCKVCDKRFTRPSSLQTHMYSHTGEKPFICEVSECGRAFSVVSNLRRHRKVHKGHSDSDVASVAGSI